MDVPGRPAPDIAQMTLLIGAVTGQHELSDEDRKAIAEWMVDHVADAPEIRELLVKIVDTQITDTTEWRLKVAEAIRDGMA